MVRATDYRTTNKASLLARSAGQRELYSIVDSVFTKYRPPQGTVEYSVQSHLVSLQHYHLVKTGGSSFDFPLEKLDYHIQKVLTQPGIQNEQ